MIVVFLKLSSTDVKRSGVTGENVLGVKLWGAGKCCICSNIFGLKGESCIPKSVLRGGIDMASMIVE